MTLDELLLEWSYRSEKGYPSLDSPSDIQVLKNILIELDLPTDHILDELEASYGDKDGKPGISGLEPGLDEPKTPETPEPETNSQPSVEGGSQEYDELIKSTLKVDEIPRTKNNYKYPGPGGATYIEQVNANDLEIWQKLWEAKPQKKTEPGVATSGVGKGEVSLYWLYHYSNSGVEVSEGRDDDDPDLYFNGNGMEVKAYGSHNAKLSIGRYGADKENLRLLSVIFGISSLARVFEGEVGKEKTINPTNFAGNDLKEAFKHVLAFSNVDLEQLSGIYPIFDEMKKNLDFVNSKIEYTTDEEGALAMGRKFLKEKLARKPGNGNHLVNIKKDGSMKFWLVDFNTLESDDDILNKMSSSQSTMNLNFTKVFG